MALIRYDFPVPAVPHTIIYSGGGVACIELLMMMTDNVIGCFLFNIKGVDVDRG